MSDQEFAILSNDKPFALALLSSRLCAKIIREAEALNAWASATVDNPVSNTRAIEAQDRVADVLREHAYADLFSDVRNLLSDSLRTLPASQLQHNLVILPMQLVRYHPGGFFRLHRDRPIEGHHRRHVSVVIYLNDNFGGGGTSFPEADYIQQPKAGSAILFSPFLPHAAERVEFGVKYAIVTWLSVPDSGSLISNHKPGE